MGGEPQDPSIELTPDQHDHAHRSGADEPGPMAAVSNLLTREVRDASLELLKHGVLEEARKPNLYRVVRTHSQALDEIYQPLHLSLRIDEIRGLAFLVVADDIYPNADDEWSHPLVRRQRLTLDQSLLVAILRQQFVAHELEAGVGAAEAQVALDDLLPHLQAFLGDLGSDSREKKRLIALLEQLKVHGIVSDIDTHERVTIRPLIAHLANPENLQNLIQAVKQLVRSQGASPKDLGEND
jgi:hypothetical protein